MSVNQVFNYTVNGTGQTPPVNLVGGVFLTTWVAAGWGTCALQVEVADGSWADVDTYTSNGASSTILAAGLYRFNYAGITNAVMGLAQQPPRPGLFGPPSPLFDISNLPVLTEPPAASGAAVAVVVPGVAGTFQAPLSGLMQGAIGESFVMKGGAADNSKTAGYVALYGGDSGNYTGGNVILVGGVGLGGGSVNLYGGPATSGGYYRGGSLNLYGGFGGGGGGGSVNIHAGNDSGAGLSGHIKFIMRSPSSTIQVNNDPSLIPVSFSWGVGDDIANRGILVATRKLAVTAIMARMDVANNTDATAILYAASSATAYAGGKQLANAIDLKGTINVTQTPTLHADLTLAVGDAIGIVVSGTPTTSSGCITVFCTPQ